MNQRAITARGTSRVPAKPGLSAIDMSAACHPLAIRLGKNYGKSARNMLCFV
jgi:hypothetical protein